MRGTVLRVARAPSTLIYPVVACDQTSGDNERRHESHAPCDTAPAMEHGGNQIWNVIWARAGRLLASHGLKRGRC